MKKFSMKLCCVLLSLCMLLAGLCVSALAAQNEPLKLVVLGDSIAAGTKLFNADVQCYGAILANTNGYNYQNYAVPGHTTMAFSEVLDKDEVKQAVEQADIITVSIGGNNFLLSNMVQMIADGLVKNDYSAMDEIMVNFEVSFDECIQKIKAFNPDAELFVQTLYNPMPGTVGEVYAQGQKRLNAAYKGYLEKNPGAYTLVDITPLFEGHADYIATDFIHPNKTGHTVIAAEYQKTFYRMGLAETETIVEPTTEQILSFDPIKMIKDLWFQLTNAINLMFAGLK